MFVTIVSKRSAWLLETDLGWELKALSRGQRLYLSWNILLLSWFIQESTDPIFWLQDDMHLLGISRANKCIRSEWQEIRESFEKLFNQKIVGHHFHYENEKYFSKQSFTSETRGRIWVSPKREMNHAIRKNSPLNNPKLSIDPNFDLYSDWFVWFFLLRKMIFLENRLNLWQLSLKSFHISTHFEKSIVFQPLVPSNQNFLSIQPKEELNWSQLKVLLGHQCKVLATFLFSMTLYERWTP